MTFREGKMFRKLLFLMMAVIFVVSFSVSSWAGDRDAAPEATASDKNSQSAISPDEGYLIGPGDVVDISVWKDDALTRSCVVRPDGALSFPLIGDVQAAGRTSSELKADLKNKLDQFVP